MERGTELRRAPASPLSGADRLSLPNRLLLAALCVALGTAGTAWAQPSPTSGGEGTTASSGDPSDGEPTPEEPSKKRKRARRELPPVRTEPGILPAISYDSDLGLGFGVITNFARIDPEAVPYRWRLGAQAFLYLRPRPEGGVEVPFQSHYVRFDKPGLASGRVRLLLELSFRRHSNAGYHGLGNQSIRSEPWKSIDKEREPDSWARARRFHEYDRIYPRAEAEVRVQLPADLFAFGSTSLAWNWFQLYEGSQLSQDLAGDPEAWQTQALVGVSRHGLLQGVAGMALDTRDDETAPIAGMFHEVSVRGGPLLELQQGFVGLNATFRFFLPIHRDWISVAARLILDGLFGSPPLYELARYGGTEADDGPGGSTSLRGVLTHRYHGRGKVLSNLELRSKFLRFRVARQRSSLGAVLFLDAGRVWADHRPRPELDGKTLGLHPGLGGGLRWQVGETFVIRLDVGWSPGQHGLYFDVGHVF